MEKQELGQDIKTHEPANPLAPVINTPNIWFERYFPHAQWYDIPVLAEA